MLLTVCAARNWRRSAAHSRRAALTDRDGFAPESMASFRASAAIWGRRESDRSKSGK
jgi:hypothetical protein